MFRSKSLEDLKGPLGHHMGSDSYLESECRRLHSVPLPKLTVENLRLLVGQKIGLKHLVPIALDILEENPLVGGHFYPGDLLNSVALAPEHFWTSHPKLNNRLIEVKIEVESLANTINEKLMPALKQRGIL